MKPKVKRVTQNLIFAGITIFALFAVALFSHISMQEAEAGMEELRAGIQNGDGEVSDMEGYAIIFNMFGYGLARLGMMIAYVLLVWIPVAFAFVMVFFTVLARAVYKDHGQHLLAYRVLMGYVYFFQIVLSLFVLIVIWDVPVLAVPIVLVQIVLLILEIRNTYAKRILI